jgi:amino acid permease
MAFILLFTGLGATFTGLFRDDWHQYIMKSHLLIFGLYFVFGSIVLLRNSLIQKEKV